MFKKLLIFPFLISALFINAQTFTADNSSSSTIYEHRSNTGVAEYHLLYYSIFSVPAKDLIVIQKKNLNTDNIDIELFNEAGIAIQKVVLYQGSTIAFFDTKTLYDGDYILKISDGEDPIIQKITFIK